MSQKIEFLLEKVPKKQVTIGQLFRVAVTQRWVYKALEKRNTF